jgi:hypothetical protein
MIHRCTALMLMVVLCFAVIGSPALAQQALTPSTIALNYGDWGILIDPSGKELIPRGVYSVIYPLGEGIAINMDESRTFLSTPSGQCRLYAAVPTKDNPDMHYALMTQDGQLLTEALYDMLSPLTDGRLLFMQNGLMGVMDDQGQVILEAEYTHLISNGAGGYLALRTDPYNEEPDGVYYIDSEGRERATGVKVSYPFHLFSDGLCAAASSDGKYGYLGTDGRWVIPPQFTFAGDFISGGAVTSLSSGSGVIDTSGNWIISPKYKWVDRTGTAMLAIQGSTLSLMKPDGSQLKTYPAADSVSSYLCNDHYGVISLESETLLIDAITGETLLSHAPGVIYNVWNTPEDSVIVTNGAFGEKCVYLYSTSGEKVAGPYQELAPLGVHNGVDCFSFSEFEASPSEDGSYLVPDEATYRTGIIDRNGKTLLPAEYTLLYQMADNRFWAETADHVGVIDLNGQWIVQYTRQDLAEQPAP